MKKIDMIRSELAKDINRSAALIAEMTDSQPQYVNMIRRRVKAEIANTTSKVLEKPKRKSSKAVGIASLYLPKPEPVKKKFYNTEHKNYYWIGAVSIVCIFAYVIWHAAQ
jgi:hypothetical protein